MQARLNSEPLIVVRDQTLSAAVLAEPGPDSSRLRLTSAGSHSWASDIDGPAQDPTFDGRSDERGFRAIAWVAANLLIVAGYRSAVFVRLDDGSLLGRYPLEFASVADFLDLAVFDDLIAVVASTRRLLFVRKDLATDWVEPEAPCAELVGFESGSVIVREYDVQNPELGFVERAYAPQFEDDASLTHGFDSSRKSCDLE